MLDPFAGTAATGVAALKNSRSFVGIEQDSEYAAIGRKRLMDMDVSSPPPYQGIVQAEPTTQPKQDRLLEKQTRYRKKSVKADQK